MFAAALCGLALAFSAADPAAADSIRDQQWSLGFLKATELAKVSQGEGVTVAVVDTGVDAAHPDLTGSVLKGVDASREPDGRTDDFTGHGTGMASLIAGHGHGSGNGDGVLGVAPKAKILPVRVGPRTGNGHPDELAKGILAAVEAGAKVICVAAAGGGTNNLKASIAYAYQKGAVVIAGVGNAPEFPEIGWPAAYPSVVAVAGVKRDGTISTVSAQGTNIGAVTLAAPSDDIVSARLNRGYEPAPAPAMRPPWSPASRRSSGPSIRRRGRPTCCGGCATPPSTEAPPVTTNATATASSTRSAPSPSWCRAAPGRAARPPRARRRRMRRRRTWTSPCRSRSGWPAGRCSCSGRRSPPSC